MSRLQRDFNNVTIIIDKSFNEIFYDFTSIQSLNFFLQKIFTNLSLKNNRLITRSKTFDVIVFDQMNVKFHYNRKYQSLFMKSKNYVLIRLHKNYNILFVISKKIDQQYVEFFLVIEKIERLFYRLIVSNHWRIYFVFNIAQLKSYFVFFDDFFRKFKFNQSNFVFVEKNIVNVKFFEIKRFINKRQIKKKKSKYLIKWKKYDFEYDIWKNLSKLDVVVNLVQKYENVIKQIITLSNRLNLFFVKILEQRFVVVISLKSSSNIVVLSKIFNAISSQLFRRFVYWRRFAFIFAKKFRYFRVIVVVDIRRSRFLKNFYHINWRYTNASFRSIKKKKFINT